MIALYVVTCCKFVKEKHFNLIPKDQEPYFTALLYFRYNNKNNIAFYVHLHVCSLQEKLCDQ